MTLWFREAASPNQDDRPPGAGIDTIVMHYTGTLTIGEAVARLSDPAARVSAHYLIDEDGSAWRLVPEQRRAWHAGVSHWRGHDSIDDRSIGIAIANPGHEWGYRPFAALQMAVVCDLCLEILSRHRVPPHNVVGHSDIAPEREQDPGELFDWEGLARNGVGIWPEDVPDLGTGGVRKDPETLRDVGATLARIGYRVHREVVPDRALAHVLRAFQRHWRPEAITGEADAGTLERLRAVARLVPSPG